MTQALRRGSAWLAVGQMRASNDIEGNFHQCSHLIQLASDRSCSLLCLPEGASPTTLSALCSALWSLFPLLTPLWCRGKPLTL